MKQKPLHENDNQRLFVTEYFKTLLLVSHITSVKTI